MPNTQRLLELALKGLEAERAKIDDEIAQIKSQLTPRASVANGAQGAGGPSTTQPKKKRKMSAAAKKRFQKQ